MLDSAFLLADHLSRLATTEEDKKRKKNGETFENAPVEVTPRKYEFFEWMEKLFWDDPEPAHWPNWIEVNPVAGKDLEKVYPPVKRFDFGGKDDPKPPKPRIAALANEIGFLVQRDADVRGGTAPRRYAVNAWHFGKNDAPYERWIIKVVPGPAHANGETGSSEDEPKSAQERWNEQKLVQDREMFNLYGGSMEGIIDRLDRIIERQDARIAKQDERIEKQNEMLERALSLEAEREDRRAWNQLKIAGARQGMDMGFAIAPPLLNGLIGKSVIPTQDTLETITLRNFFKTKDQGGSLTADQASLAFGAYDDAGQKLLRPGVLSPEQVQVLLDVAFCRAPPDDLDKIMPWGPLAITLEQAAALQSQCGFTMQQLAPIHLIFEARQNKRQKQQAVESAERSG